MMANAGLLFLMCLMVLGSVNGTQDGCFDFPTLSSGLVVTARENTAVSFPFRLQVETPACSGLKRLATSIYISRRSETSITEFCVLRVTSVTCSTVFNKENCKCSSVDGSGGSAFTFTKTMTSEDGGSWLWKVGDVPSHWAAVFFDVLSADGRSRYTPGGSLGLHFPWKTIKPAVREEMGGLSTTSLIANGSNEGQLPGGWALFGGVFVGVNILTIIVVAAVVYVLRGRHERRRRSTIGMLPPTAKNKKEKAKKGKRDQETTRDDAAPSLMELANRPESCYYENSEAVSFAVTNAGYEIPKQV